MQTTKSNNGVGDPEENAPVEFSRGSKISAWAVTTAVALAALGVSIYGISAQQVAKNLAQQQSNQIAGLQKTTPVGEIQHMLAHSGETPASIADIRNDPVLRQQIYDLSGVSSDVPDNGSLFMVVHDYSQPTPYFSDPSTHYFITGITLSGKSVDNQRWSADGVYVGGPSAPNKPLSYRLTLYFCNSVDAKKIVAATSTSAAKNFGLPSLPYPTCRQLDSIFVIRAAK